MSSNLPTAPVVVIGMHRSGTTMVTRVLEQLGVFMGTGLSHNAESELIVALNDWLLWQGSGAWDNPEPFRDVLGCEPVRAMAVDYLRTMLGSPRSAPFVGRSRALRGATVLGSGGRWGLKDPRMTYTLPLWLELWPDARVISVNRHGVDVASSLKVRVERTLDRVEARYRRLRRGYLVKPKHQRLARLAATVRCARLEGGFALWDEYSTEAARQVAALGPRALQLRFEDFLQDPLGGVRQVAAFCELPVDDDAASAIARGIDGGRAFAFEGRSELRRFSAQEPVAAALRRHGYEPALPPEPAGAVRSAG